MNDKTQSQYKQINISMSEKQQQFPDLSIDVNLQQFHKLENLQQVFIVKLWAIIAMLSERFECKAGFNCNKQNITYLDVKIFTSCQLLYIESAFNDLTLCVLTTIILIMLSSSIFISPMAPRRLLNILQPAILLTHNKFWMTEISNQLAFTAKFFEVTVRNMKAINEKLRHQSAQHFLRLQIFAGEGCEGFTYKFRFDNQIDAKDDYVKSISQIKSGSNAVTRIVFAVNKSDVKLLKGSTIDYAEQMMREVFYVKENPNAEIECSCKVSFSPKIDLL